MEDYTTLNSYFYLKSFSFHQNSDSQTNLFEYMSNHQSSSNTPSQLSLLCKTFKSPELQQAEVNLIVITCRHLPYLDSVSLIFSTTFPSVTPKKMTTTLFRQFSRLLNILKYHISRHGTILQTHTGLFVNKQSEEHNLQTVSGSTACKKNWCHSEDLQLCSALRRHYYFSRLFESSENLWTQKIKGWTHILQSR